MFLAKLEKPWVNKNDDDEIYWESELLVIDVQTENEAMEQIRNFVSPKEKQIEDDLVRYYSRKPDEYYEVFLYEVPAAVKIFSLGDYRNVVFPKPYKVIKF